MSKTPKFRVVADPRLDMQAQFPGEQITADFDYGGKRVVMTANHTGVYEPREQGPRKGKRRG